MKTFDDSGVSESLGYILVFAIVLTGIAGIVFFGVTMLNDAKDRNNFQNVEQGLTVVQSDLKRVAMEKAPVKTTKMHVEGGVLSTNFSSSSHPRRFQWQRLRQQDRQHHVLFEQRAEDAVHRGRRPVEVLRRPVE